VSHRGCVKNIEGHAGGHKVTEECNTDNIPAVKELVRASVYVFYCI
jgi:hypothetical protein